MFGLFKNTFRFQILFLHGQVIRYALKGNSPVRLLGYVSGYYERGEVPMEEWDCFFYSNATKKSFRLESTDFSDPVQILTQNLFNKLDEVDGRWSGMKGSDLRFEDSLNKVEIKIETNAPRDWSKILQDMQSGIQREKDFFGVMDTIFTKV